LAVPVNHFKKRKEKEKKLQFKSINLIGPALPEMLRKEPIICCFYTTSSTSDKMVMKDRRLIYNITNDLYRDPLMQYCDVK
jgi:hypothetical protein